MGYQLIETIEVGSGGATLVEFLSIPQDGVDLVIQASTRNNLQTFNAGLWIRINNDTTANAYVVRWLKGDGSSASSGTQTYSENFIGYMPASNTTANTFGSISATFPNYSLSGSKTWSSDSVTENNATAVDMRLFAGSWSGNSAITSLQFFSPNVNLAQNSTISLYKITAD